MGVTTEGHGRWTAYFVVASAVGLVAFLGTGALDIGRQATAVFGLFWFVCPMVFGMAYVLLPPYAGRTLAVDRLPGVHLLATCVGASLVTVWVVTDAAWALRAGATVWAVGVAIFLGSLAASTVPGLLEDPEIVLRSPDRPQRSTRVGTAAIPVALGYLLVGTAGLLVVAGVLPTPPGALAAALPVTLPGVLHAYAMGFGALLVFALGVRLLTGFFHVTPPRRASRVFLLCGAVGPAFLSTAWAGPWFRLGAGLEAVAMGGYALLVGSVAARSSWDRVGLYGVVSGAVAGAGAVAVAVLVVGRALPVAALDVHALLVLEGFFPLTIVGYAYQFFPVTEGQFRGARPRVAAATIALLAVGVAGHAVGTAVASRALVLGGVAAAALAATGYAYLVTRRVFPA